VVLRAWEVVAAAARLLLLLLEAVAGLAGVR
jgi:hypothetical protein